VEDWKLWKVDDDKALLCACFWNKQRRTYYMSDKEFEIFSLIDDFLGNLAALHLKD
jgi:hypothetical protein